MPRKPDPSVSNRAGRVTPCRGSLKGPDTGHLTDSIPHGPSARENAFRLTALLVLTAAAVGLPAAVAAGAAPASSRVSVAPVEAVGLLPLSDGFDGPAERVEGGEGRAVAAPSASSIRPSFALVGGQLREQHEAQQWVKVKALEDAAKAEANNNRTREG